MNNRINPTPENITLRDWFAGQALSGMKDLKGGYVSEQDLNSHNLIATWAAEAAYRYADAMLDERERERQTHD